MEERKAIQAVHELREHRQSNANTKLVRTYREIEPEIQRVVRDEISVSGEPLGTESHPTSAGPC